MKKLLVSLLVLFSLFTLHSTFYAPAALAHCPLCVAGAGVGLTLSRWIGLDDSITGLWLGAFLGAISFWSYISLTRKVRKQKLIWLKPIIYLAVFATTIWSFYKFNLVIRMEKMYGLDKLTFGIVSGGTALYLIEIINDLIIKIKGRTLFPYQRLVSGLAAILTLSVIVYILIGYYI